MDKDKLLSRWWAVLELVRAQDAVREMVTVGRAAQADTDRLRDANARWDAVR